MLELGRFQGAELTDAHANSAFICLSHGIQSTLRKLLTNEVITIGREVKLKIVCLFNNKGGVGKTTFLFHLAYRLAELGQRVLLVDADGQCNLTAYCLPEAEIENSWGASGNSLYKCVEPLVRGLGDIRECVPTEVAANLHLLPGDLMLSEFEDLLGDTWNAAKGGAEQPLRVQSAIYRSIKSTAKSCNAKIVLIDLGPNLGALNRAVLGGGDYIIVPIAPDLFSIRGTENLGTRLVTWRKEWDQINAAWSKDGLEIPKGRPKFLGYVTQHHTMRNNATGMTRGWSLFGERVKAAVDRNVIQKLEPLQQNQNLENPRIADIPNLNSLIPYSQEARLPIYQCTSSHGLKGAHLQRAVDTRNLFNNAASVVMNL